MQLAAMITFGAALALIVLLFEVKRAEVRRGARFVEGVRAKADVRAVQVKELLYRAEFYLEHTPWFVSALTRYGVHVGALAFAKLARMSEEQAHRLADFVSHKRNFERRETKSQFLKQVSEHPIRNREGSNGAGKNGNGKDNGGVATM
jgi:hypothetical protein